MMYEGTIAEIRVFAGDYEPKGWVFCEGQLLRIDRNTALYSLLGTRFGGDGRFDFALPRLAHPVEGLRYVICIAGFWPPRP